MKKNRTEPSPIWSDPDDAPEITEEWAASADLFDGQKPQGPRHRNRKARNATTQDTPSTGTKSGTQTEPSKAAAVPPLKSKRDRIA